MTPQEVHIAVSKELISAHDRVHAWFFHPPQVRAWLPKDDRWSIDEILHHITLTNHYLLILIDKATQKSLNARARGEQLVWPIDYQLIPVALQDADVLRAFTWHRPDHMDPRLHPATGDVKDLMRAQLARCNDLLGSLEGGWGNWCKTTMSVNAIGKIDVYQYIVFFCKHIHRHCAQMEANVVAMNLNV
jgi:DinB superfamily